MRRFCECGHVDTEHEPRVRSGCVSYPAECGGLVVYKTRLTTECTGRCDCVKFVPAPTLGDGVDPSTKAFLKEVYKFVDAVQSGDRPRLEWCRSIAERLRAKLLETPKLIPLNGAGEMMTLARFRVGTEHRFLTSDGGSGYYATEAGYDPDSGCFHEQPEWATHVVWFSK